MNILNKTNKSQVPVCGNLKNQVPKREKYSWSKPCSPGTFLLVSKEDLNIDGTYQREQASEAKVREIAREWDWKLYGALSVILRPDGSMWIFDGGHRCRAAFLRDDITELPCMVFAVGDHTDEARAFLGTNLLQSAVTAYHKHRASVITSEPTALAAQAILTKYGYVVARAASKNGFAAIGTLRKIVKEDARTADRVFSACVELAGNHQDPISGEVIEGLFRCQRRLEGKADILSNGNLEKLKKETLPGIEAALRREKHIAGRGGAMVGAKAILDMLNKGKHRRLTWS